MSRGFQHGPGRDMRITTNARDGSRDFFDHDDRDNNNGGGRQGRGGGRGGSGGNRGRGGGGHHNSNRGGGGQYNSYRGGGGGQSEGGKWQRGGGRGRRGKSKGYNRNQDDGRRPGGGPSPLSRLEDEDGDFAMGDEESRTSRGDRFNPYGGGRRDRDRRRGGPRDKGGPSRDSGRGGPSHGLFAKALDSVVPNRNGPRDSKGSRDRGRRGDQNRHSEDTWWKVTIPFGKKHDKEWLLSAIRNICTVPFQVTEYHYIQNAAAFFIEDKATADALRDVSKRITAKTGHKVVIQTRPCKPPRNHPALGEKTIQVLKETMSKRYDPSTKQLNLSNMFHDEDFKANSITMPLNKPSNMVEVIKIIAEHIPEIVLLNLSQNRLYSLQTLSDLVSKAPDLKYLDLSENAIKNEQDLDHIKGLKLEELRLKGNPFCTSYKDTSQYYSVVRKRFPKLLKLDGEVLPPPIEFDLEETTTLPPIQRSFMVSPDIEGVLTKFIEHYYNVFDSSNRQALLEAYHEQARFSLSASAGPNAPSHIRSVFGQYIRDSRNLVRIDDGNLRTKLLKQGKLATVAFLNELPEMQHDTSSFQVDVSRAEPNLLAFTVHGIFKDVQNKSGDQPLIAFSRFFITVPNPATGCLIVNDELCLRPPTNNQKRAAFSLAAPTPSPSPVTVPAGSPSQGLTPEQQAMVQQFIQDSQMNAEWSLKCLQENNWDYPAAGQVFIQLKASGSIPMEAFVK